MDWTHALVAGIAHALGIALGAWLYQTFMARALRRMGARIGRDAIPVERGEAPPSS